MIDLRNVKITVIKKVLLVILTLSFLVFTIKVNASDNEVPIPKGNGDGNVTYIGSDELVTIPVTYNLKDSEVRATWVSALTGDISGFSTITQYKNQILEVLDNMEYYNMNVMIFHVRIMNDALYESKYNSWSKYYNTDPSWDALPWIIEECHRRGIEFHAWLNPYRISTASSLSVEEIAKKFPALNAASNPNNILKGSSSVILNPGEPSVRTFLINTCMELVEKYEVDAINFDDYFYTADVDDSITRQKYNPTNMSVENWRREQIDLFIEGLSKAIRNYNTNNNRRVQLGIAPSGIWKSAGADSYVNYDSDGNAISNGSGTTSGFSHYGGTLFADTLKWVNDEWIDYILPQTYWAIEHSSAGFPDLIDWWDKVVKYKNVNLYASMGLYMRTSSGNSSWYSNTNEAYNQIMYSNKLENVRGTSIYDYKDIVALKDTTRDFVKNRGLWRKPAILPEIRTMDRITIDPVANLDLEILNDNYKIKFDKVNDAKFYVIYRSKNEITYDASEVIDIIGDISDSNVIEYIDQTSSISDNYNYGIRSQSYSLTLSEGVSKSTIGAFSGSKVDIGEVTNVTITDNLFPNETITLKWDELYYSYGTDMEYKLLYSYDDINYQDALVDPVISAKGYCTASYKIPSNEKEIYFKIQAENNIGIGYSKVLKIDVIQTLGEIYNFAIMGNNDYFCTKEKVKLSWTNYQLHPNTTYYLQMSSDGSTFTTVDTINSDLETSFVDYQMPSTRGVYYYRIMGELNGSIGYSKIIEVDLYSYLGDFYEYTIDGKEPLPYYVVNETDSLYIICKKNKVSGEIVNYQLRVSTDKKYWLPPKTYANNSKIDYDDDYFKQQLYFSSSAYKLYIYLEGSSVTRRATTDIIEIYIIPEYMFIEELGDFIIDEQNNVIEKMDIFN